MTEKPYRHDPQYDFNELGRMLEFTEQHIKDDPMKADYDDYIGLRKEMYKRLDRIEERINGLSDDKSFAEDQDDDHNDDHNDRKDDRLSNREIELVAKLQHFYEQIQVNIEDLLVAKNEEDVDKSQMKELNGRIQGLIQAKEYFWEVFEDYIYHHQD